MKPYIQNAVNEKTAGQKLELNILEEVGNGTL